MKWIIDEDGDIGLTFWGVVTFIKYKELEHVRGIVAQLRAGAYA